MPAAAEATPHILIVDDHQDIRELLGRFLEKHEMRTSLAANAVEARKALKANAFDLAVVDIMMPGEDGLSLTRFIQETAGFPVILLTAKAEDVDRIIGLELGADDYVTKPFNPRELVARIKAVLRRANALPAANGETAGSGRLKFSGFILDLDQQTLLDKDGVTIPLSTGEFRLLQVMLERPNMVLSRDQLLDLTRGRQANLFDRAIDNQVSRLRKKIEPNPKTPEIIKTVWGGGYRFNGKVERL